MVAPSITRAATLARGRPVALETKGIVREARGLASRTKTSPSRTATCRLIRPRIPRARARSPVYRRMVSCTDTLRLGGGSTHAESPEWMPASSMCSMIPPTRSSSPSKTASTSTSTARSRKRSISTGAARGSTSPSGAEA